MTYRRIRHGQRLLGWMTLAGGAFVLLYWTLYFSHAVDLGQNDPLVHAFESAFPVADAVFTAALFAASYHLLRGSRPGPFLLAVAGSMSLYLGLLDATFYFGNGTLPSLDIDAVIGSTVNVLCIGGGIAALRFCWRDWMALARPRPSVRGEPRSDVRRLEIDDRFQSGLDAIAGETGELTTEAAT